MYPLDLLLYPLKKKFNILGGLVWPPLWKKPSTSMVKPSIVWLVSIFLLFIYRCKNASVAWSVQSRKCCATCHQIRWQHQGNLLAGKRSYTHDLNTNGIKIYPSLKSDPTRSDHLLVTSTKSKMRPILLFLKCIVTVSVPALFAVDNQKSFFGLWSAVITQERLLLRKCFLISDLPAILSY